MSHIPTIPDGVIMAVELPSKRPGPKVSVLHMGYYDKDGENVIYLTGQLSHERFHSEVYNNFVLRGMVRAIHAAIKTPELLQFDREVHHWEA